MLLSFIHGIILLKIHLGGEKMNTRILVNQVENRIIGINNGGLFFAATGVVCPKLNNVLARRKWIIFDNK